MFRQGLPSYSIPSSSPMNRRPDWTQTERLRVFQSCPLEKLSASDAMKLNAVPFLAVPGMALAGYLVGGWPGVVWALGVWCAVAALGTLIHVLRHRHEATPRDAPPRDAPQDGEGPPRKPSLHNPRH
jgi:hypothetical protein